MKAKRKICVAITARPSYSRIKTAMKAIQQNENLELQIVLTGSSLLDRYGSIVQTLEADGFFINEKVFIVLEGETPLSMAKTTGLGVMELSNVFYNLSPDVVVVIADRFETLAVSIAAAYQNIPLAHVQGGEITGNIDEKVRHANTKLADIHFVATENARQRVLRLGEDPDFTFNTGCPSVDIASEILKEPALDFDPYKKYGGVGETPDYTNRYLVVMQHPVTTEYESSKKQITETLHAVNDLAIPAFWFWPNIDAGADQVSRGIRSFREHYLASHIHFFKNMGPGDFLRLLHNSACLIGNSSAGIRECSYLGVPAVNIGTRQQGRERGNNVTDAGYDKDEIKKAIEYSIINKRPAPSNIYGGGNAGKKIADILAYVPLRSHKKINF